MGWLTEIMKEFLVFLNGLTNSYGLAIILFTIIVNILMHPLTLKQQRSMKDMQEIQPKMKKLQEKYKDDKEKLNEETMKLYQENNVNPAGGCLPMIIMMLIIWPLFRAINDLEMAESFLWISNLMEPDILLLVLNVLAMVGQTYYQQKVSGNKQGGAMMWIGPGMIAIMGLQFPAGVLVYWLTRTIISVIQQYFIHKKPEVKGAAE